VRRELAERYGSKKLYEGGLSVRSTLDAKPAGSRPQDAGRRLVRYDEAHGWRGRRCQASGRAATGASPWPRCRISDVQPWRLAMVLDVTDRRRAHRPSAGARANGTLSRCARSA
jgi:penicillin-binding protein 1A